MEAFEISFDYHNRVRYKAMVERREGPPVQYIVYFPDQGMDLTYGQLIYEVKSGQLMNNDDKTLQDASLIAQIGLEIKNYLQDHNIDIGS
jgi:hypothetical protein